MSPTPDRSPNPLPDEPSEDVTDVGADEAAYETFGDVIRAHRQRVGWTQHDLADRSGVSFRAISDLERHINLSAQPHTAQALASAFGLSGARRERFVGARRRGARITPRLKGGQPVTSQRVIGLIGRDAELAHLTGWMAGDGPPLLVIGGDPGIGKSRLLASAEERALQSGWVVLRGASRQLDRQLPYAPLIRALADYLAGLSPSERRRQLKGCEWLVRLLPELAETMPVPAPDWELSPDQERRLVFAAAGRFLGALAASRGVLLTLEDVQWAAPDGLSLLADLTRTAAGAGYAGRLRILATVRDASPTRQRPLSAFMSELMRDGALTRLRLGPLDDTSAIALVRAALHAEGSVAASEHETLERKIVARAGGIPLFLIAFAREARARSGGASSLLAADDDATLTIPRSIVELVQQQMRGLSDITTDTLGLAALNGRETPLALLIAASVYSERQVVEAIEAACAARLLEQREDAVCAFPHDLYREAIDSGLSEGRRKMLHESLALALNADSQRPQPVALAFHYSESADVAHAALSLENAGDHALSLRAHQSADACYHDAIARAATYGDASAEGRLWSKIGALSMGLGKYDGALAAYERAVASYERAGDRDGAGLAIAEIGWAQVRHATGAAGLARVEAFLTPDVVASLAPLTRAALLRAHAILLFALNRYDEQLASARLAVVIAREEGNVKALARGLRLEGLALVLLGRLDEALLTLGETLKRAELARDLDSFSAALNDIAAVYRAQGQLRQSKAHSERSVAVAEDLGDPTGIAFLTSSHGDDLFLLGDWKAARTRYEKALEVARGIGSSWVSAYPLLSLGALNLAEGRAADAARLLAEALDLAKRNDDLQALRCVQTVLAERDLLAEDAVAALGRLQPLLDPAPSEEKEVIALLPLFAWAKVIQGEDESAMAVLDLCLERVKARGNRIILEDALITLARVRAFKRDWVGARQAVEDALAFAQGMSHLYGEVKAQYVYGWICFATHESAQAIERFERARAICVRLGEALYRSRLESVLRVLGSGRAVGGGDLRPGWLRPG